MLSVNVTEAMVYEKVKATYQKATDLGLVTTDIDVVLASGQELPKTAGVYNVVFEINGRNDTLKTIKIYVVNAPVVTALTDGKTYLSSDKTNKNVELSISQITGFTLKYSKNDGAAVNVTANMTVTTEELATYKFWYEGFESYSSSFVVDICKTNPTLKINGSEPGSNSVYGVETFAAIAATFPRRNNVTASYTVDGSAPNNYTPGDVLLKGSYIFTLTDSYDNVSTYNFIVDATAPEVEIEFRTNTNWVSAETGIQIDWNISAVLNSTVGATEFMEYKVGEDGDWIKGSEVLADADGENVLFFRTGDELGRYSSEVKVMVKIDLTKPEITAESYEMEIEIEVLTEMSLEEVIERVKAGISDNFDEKAVLSATVYEEIYFNKLGSHILVLTATDHVGHISDQIEVTVSVKDSTKPIIGAEKAIKYKVATKITATQLLADIKAMVTDNFDGDITINVTGFAGIDFSKVENIDTTLILQWVYHNL